MVDGIIIRLARPDELEAAGKLTLASYSSLPEFLEADPDNYGDTLLDAQARSIDAEVFVAVKGDVLLGCVTYVGDSTSSMSEWDESDAAGFRMLAVPPDAMGMGVGRKLAMFCVERARASGKRSVLLHSTPFMTSAQKLYRSLGFERFEAIDFEVETVRLLGFRLDF